MPISHVTGICAAAPAGSPPLKVLLVAARAAVIEPVSQALAGDHIDFRFCADPAEAAILAAPWRLAAVLVDLPWAGRPGRELVQTLRTDRRTRRTPVIIVGERSRHQSREAAERIGADGFACLADERPLFETIHALATAEHSIAA